MSYVETRKMVDSQVEAADRYYNRIYKKYGFDKLQREWIKAGVWEVRGKDGKWRTLKLRKPKQAKPDMRFASGRRDTAKPEIAIAGKPGSESRIAAMIDFYNNPLNVGQSAFTITDEQIADGLVGLIAGNVRHAAYDVDAIDSLDE